MTWRRRRASATTTEWGPTVQQEPARHATKCCDMFQSDSYWLRTSTHLNEDTSEDARETWVEPVIGQAHDAETTVPCAIAHRVSRSP